MVLDEVGTDHPGHVTQEDIKASKGAQERDREQQVLQQNCLTIFLNKKIKDKNVISSFKLLNKPVGMERHEVK